MSARVQKSSKWAVMPTFFTPAGSGLLQRECACGAASGATGVCALCQASHLTGSGAQAKRLGDSEGSPIIPETLRENGARQSTGYGHDFARTAIRPQSIAIKDHSIDRNSEDPIHSTMTEEYRRSVGEVPGMPQISDAALKYGGVLARAGSAQWVASTLNRRNLADVWFNRAVLVGGPAGQTTPVINGRRIGDNLDVEQALPLPPIESRVDGGRTRCWFARGVNAVGQTNMDILTAGPWTHIAPQAEVATRLARESLPSSSPTPNLAPCRTGGGTATVRVTGPRGDAEMEEYIRLGEAEHDVDDQLAFQNNIGRLVGNVNALIGGRPELELSGADLATCRSNLLRLASHDSLTRQFVLDINAAGARRHAGGRHGVFTSGITVDASCSSATVTLSHGTL